MLKFYSINADTLAIIPVNTKVSKIIEREKTLLVKKCTTDIIDDSCRYFGSTYEGRKHATNDILGIKYKSPIIIEETRRIIFFPTCSPRYNNCYWISLSAIKKSEKIGDFCSLQLDNGYELMLNISNRSFLLQFYKANLLDSTIRKRISIDKNV